MVITDINKLKAPATPLEFLTATGVKKEEVEEITVKLKEIMEADKTILSLSAPQIGINKRIFCIRFEDIIKTFVNPIITKKTDFKIAPETCISMPGKEILIARPEDITIVYYTNEFKYEENKLLGAAARIFDQQAQMLDGTTPDELGLVSDVEEDGSLSDLTQEEIKELIETYKQFIKAKSEAMQQAINADSELAEQYKKLKFTEDVITGKTLVIGNEPHKNRAQRRAAVKQAKQIKAKKAGKK